MLFRWSEVITPVDWYWAQIKHERKTMISNERSRGSHRSFFARGLDIESTSSTFQQPSVEIQCFQLLNSHCKKSSSSLFFIAWNLRIAEQIKQINRKAYLIPVQSAAGKIEKYLLKSEWRFSVQQFGQFIIIVLQYSIQVVASIFCTQRRCHHSSHIFGWSARMC